MILSRLLPRDRLAVKSKGPGMGDPSLADFLGIGRETAAGVRVDEQEALSLSAVFAGVWLYSIIIGSLPLNVFVRRGRSKEIAEMEPAQFLLHTSPNAEMTAKRMRGTLDFHRRLWGNCYAEIQWAANGRPFALWPIEPWRVKPERDAARQLVYRVDHTRIVQRQDMIHVPLISLDGVVGRSFVDYAIESLGLGIASQEFAARFFGNGAVPGGILEHPANLKKESRTELKREWEEAHRGPKKSNRVAVLWGGLKFNAAAGSIAPEHAQLLETRRFFTEEVARWLNIPPHLLRDLSRSTFSNIEAQQIDFVTYSLGPELVDYEQEYDRKLLDPPTLFSKHNLGALLRGDSASRGDWYTKMFSIAAYTINDILEFEDRNPIGPEGDRRFVPANLISLDRALADPASAMPLAGDGEHDQEHDQEQDQQEDQEQKKSAMTTVFRDVLGRMLRKEANAMCRAAKEPLKLFDWLENFYGGHELLLADALAAAFEAAGTLLGIPPARISEIRLDQARAWASWSKSCIVELSGRVKPAEFQTAIESLAAEWGRSRCDRTVGIFLEALEHEHKSIAGTN